MKKVASVAMIVLGVGMVMFAISAYTPGTVGQSGGWDLSCRYMMALGAMLATGGKLLV